MGSFGRIIILLKHKWSFRRRSRRKLHEKILIIPLPQVGSSFPFSEGVDFCPQKDGVVKKTIKNATKPNSFTAFKIYK